MLSQKIVVVALAILIQHKNFDFISYYLIKVAEA